MKHLGDICKINGAEIEPVWCISFGSPCQDLSVAGKRAGLSGSRSSLFLEAIRVIKEMREHDRSNGRSDELIRPRFAVFENVPGVFSSNGGEDFRCVLEEFVGIKEDGVTIPRPSDNHGKWAKAGCILGDSWSIAWRVLDPSMGWGVPQRRKRVTLIMDLGGLSAGEILFEREGCEWDSEEEREPWKGIARYPEESPGESYTLKIRGGREIDSLGKRAGKGALVQTELAGTMSVSQDQTLFR